MRSIEMVCHLVASSHYLITVKLRVTGLCAGNSPVTGEFPAQMASNAENVSIWWRHHVLKQWRLIAKGAPRVVKLQWSLIKLKNVSKDTTLCVTKLCSSSGPIYIYIYIYIYICVCVYVCVYHIYVHGSSSRIIKSHAEYYIGCIQYHQCHDI